MLVTTGTQQTSGGSITMPVADHPQHAALDSMWQSFYASIGSYNLKGHPVFLNTWGEKLPSGWSVPRIRSFVEAGGIWVDWCGWPFYTQGSQAFFGMAANMGLSMPNATFKPLTSAYPYPRGLMLRQQQPSPRFVVNNYSQHAYFSYYQPSEGSWFTSFGLKYGKGAYLYAYGNDGQPYGAIVDLVHNYQKSGVSASNYSSFFASILNGLPDINYSGPSVSPQSGPTTVSSGGSSSSSGGGSVTITGNNGGGSTTTQPTNPTSPTPNNPTQPTNPNGQNGQLILLTGILAAGYGLYKYGYNRGWF